MESSTNDLHLPELPELSPWIRIGLWVLGWFLVLLGIAGLVLPGLQGILTLLLSAATFSLVSHGFLRLLHRLFKPWPRAWDKVLGLRQSILRRLQRQSPR